MRPPNAMGVESAGVPRVACQDAPISSGSIPFCTNTVARIPRFHSRPVLEAVTGPISGMRPQVGPSMRASCGHAWMAESEGCNVRAPNTRAWIRWHTGMITESPAGISRVRLPSPHKTWRRQLLSVLRLSTQVAAWEKEQVQRIKEVIQRGAAGKGKEGREGGRHPPG